MSAIVTDRFKKELLSFLVREIGNPTSNYYVAVGKSEAWANNLDSPDMPINNYINENDFRKGMQGIIKISAASLVVERFDWKKGTVYSQYDDKLRLNEYSSPFFVLNNDYGVFVCLRTGRDDQGVPVPSTVQPTAANNDPFELSDGYVWKFLYTVSTLKASLFMSKNYMPTQTIDFVDSNSNGIALKQYEIQNTARPKMITSFIVDDSGSGYSSNVTLNINEQVTNKVDIFVDSSTGGIAKVEYKNDSSTLDYISGVDGALLTLVDSNGVGGVIRPVISSNKGFGKDAPSDLLCNSVMFNVKIAGDDDDFITLQDFRQIAILKDPMDSAQGNPFTDVTGKSLYSMTLSACPISFTKDRYFEGTTSGAVGIVDDINNTGTELWYHQNDSTGYVAFQAGETITEQGGIGNATIADPRVKPEVDPWSGDILYLHNRTAVERVINQTEDIKIVVELTECSTGSNYATWGSVTNPVIDGGNA